jgi:hypothetical protein
VAALVLDHVLGEAVEAEGVFIKPRWLRDE